jgi:hypothetical protein
MAAGDGVTTGYAKLDPTLPKDRLVTGWRMLIPASWLVVPGST